MKYLKTIKMTTQKNNWVPHVQGSDGVRDFSKKAWFNDCDFLRVKQRRVPYNEREIQ